MEKNIMSHEKKSLLTIDEMNEKINELVKTVDKLSERKEKEEESVFETLGHGECVILTKSKEGFLVAQNISGIITIKRVKEEKGEV